MRRWPTHVRPWGEEAQDLWRIWSAPVRRSQQLMPPSAEEDASKTSMTPSPERSSLAREEVVGSPFIIMSSGRSVWSGTGRAGIIEILGREYSWARPNNFGAIALMWHFCNL